YLAVLSANGRPAELRLWEIATGKLVRTCRPMCWVSSGGGVVFSADGQTIGIVSDPCRYNHWTAKAEELVAWDKTADEQYMWFQPNNQEILQGTERDRLENWYRLRQAGEFVKLLNLQTGEEIMTYPFPATMRELPHRDPYYLLPPTNRENAGPESL